MVKLLRDYALLTLGVAVGAIAMYYFALPYNLVTGTVAGMCLVLNQLLNGTPDTLSYMLIGMNICLLVIAFMTIGRDFGAKTVYTSLIFGPLMQVCDRIYPYTNFTHEWINGEFVQVRYSVLSADMSGCDVWFDILSFSFLLAISQAFLFRNGASTGGFDIVAKILNKFTNMDLGMGVTICGACACLSGFLINDFRMVVIGIITTWVNGAFIDYFMSAFNRKKRVCVITDQYERVRDYILHDMNRGCSLYTLRGGYSDEQKIEIQALLTPEELGHLLHFISQNHIPAFTTAGNCSEVYGNWRPSENVVVKHLKHKDKK